MFNTLNMKLPSAEPPFFYHLNPPASGEQTFTLVNLLGATSIPVFHCFPIISLESFLKEWITGAVARRFTAAFNVQVLYCFPQLKNKTVSTAFEPFKSAQRDIQIRKQFSILICITARSSIKPRPAVPATVNVVVTQAWCCKWGRQSEKTTIRTVHKSRRWKYGRSSIILNRRKWGDFLGFVFYGRLKELSMKKSVLLSL